MATGNAPFKSAWLQRYKRRGLSPLKRYPVFGVNDVALETAMISWFFPGNRLAATETNDTAALSGTVTVSGALNKAETGSDTCAISGVLSPIDTLMDSVALLIPFDGANNGTAFTDIKSHALTTIGAAVTSTTQAKFGTAGYFNGSGAALSTPHSADLGMTGQVDFCVEFWIYLPTGSTGGRVIGCGTNWVGVNWGVTIAPTLVPRVDWGNTAVTSSGLLWGTALSTNAWNFVKVSATGTVLQCWINGVSQGTGVIDDTLKPRVAQSGDFVLIGKAHDNTLPLNAYLDDLRVTIGNSRVSTNTTVPTTAFPTTLLTRTGTLSATESSSDSSSIIGSVAANKLVAVESPDTCLILAFQVDSLIANTQLLIHFDSGIVDEIGHALANNWVSTSTSPVKFGTSSGYFNGSSWLVSLNSASLDVGAGVDFCIECWVYLPTGSSGGQIVKYGKPTNFVNWGLLLDSSGVVNFSYGNSSSSDNWAMSNPSGIPRDQWVFIKASKTGTAVQCWVNGASYYAASTVVQDTAVIAGCSLYIGKNPESTLYFTGYLDDLRVTIGNSRASTNTLVPVAPFANPRALLGSFASTEVGTDSLALSGSVKVSGTLAVTESGVDALSETGKAAVSGSLVVAEASTKDSLVCSGKVYVSGSLIKTETGVDSFVFSGNVTVSGSLVKTETGTDTAALSGNVAVLGSLTKTEASVDTLSVSGKVAVSGSLMVTESGVDALSETGKAAVSGSLVVAEASTKDSLVCSGKVYVSGSLIKTETGVDSLAFQATVADLGRLGRLAQLAAIDASLDSAALAGQIFISGHIPAIELVLDSSLIQGKVAVSGSLSKAESSVDTLGASGKVTASGALIAVETSTKDSFSAYGLWDRTGQLTVSEASTKDTLAASGKVYVSGSLTGHELGLDLFNLNWLFDRVGYLIKTESTKDSLFISGKVAVAGSLAKAETITDTAYFEGVSGSFGQLLAQEGWDVFAANNFPEISGTLICKDERDLLDIWGFSTETFLSGDVICYIDFRGRENSTYIMNIINGSNMLLNEDSSLEPRKIKRLPPLSPITVPPIVNTKHGGIFSADGIHGISAWTSYFNPDGTVSDTAKINNYPTTTASNALIDYNGAASILYECKISFNSLDSFWVRTHTQYRPIVYSYKEVGSTLYDEKYPYSWKTAAGSMLVGPFALQKQANGLYKFVFSTFETSYYPGDGFHSPGAIFSNPVMLQTGYEYSISIFMAFPHSGHGFPMARFFIDEIEIPLQLSLTLSTDPRIVGEQYPDIVRDAIDIKTVSNTRINDMQQPSEYTTYVTPYYIVILPPLCSGYIDGISPFFEGTIRLLKISKNVTYFSAPRSGYLDVTESLPNQVQGNTVKQVTKYFLRGFDTGINDFVYWSSVDSVLDNPTTNQTTPSFIGSLVNICLIGSYIYNTDITPPKKPYLLPALSTSINLIEYTDTSFIKASIYAVDGLLYYWGMPSFAGAPFTNIGQYDNYLSTNSSFSPIKLNLPFSIKSFAMAISTNNLSLYSFFVTKENTLWRAGIDPITSITTIFEVYDSSPVYSSVQCLGEAVFLVRKLDNSLYVIGNSSPVLGLGQTSNSSDKLSLTLLSAIGFKNVYAANSGFNSAPSILAISYDDKLYGWGHNSYGELGLGDTNPRHEPTLISNETIWHSATLEYSYSFAITKTGEAYCAGMSQEGLLDVTSELFTYNGVIGLDGYNNIAGIDPRLRPITRFIRFCVSISWDIIVASKINIAGLDTNGNLYTWGLVNYGADGQNSDYFTVAIDPIWGTITYPIKVGSLNNYFYSQDLALWNKVSMGFDRMFVRRKDGTWWACGNGLYGSLGLTTYMSGLVNPALNPIVDLPPDIVDIYCSNYSTFAISK